MKNNPVTNLHLYFSNLVSTGVGKIILQKKTIKERIKRGQYIYAPNHPCTLDPFFMLGIIKKPVQILIIEDAFKIPVLKYFLNMSKHIKVCYGKGDEAYNEAIKYLNKGRSLVVFPEGVITKDMDKLKSIKTGVIRMAMETGTPIIPIGIYLDKKNAKSKYKDFGRGLQEIRYYLKGKYVVNFGKPITFRGNPENRGLVKIYTAILKNRINHSISKSKQQYERMSR